MMDFAGPNPSYGLLRAGVANDGFRCAQPILHGSAVSICFPLAHHFDINIQL